MAVFGKKMASGWSNFYEPFISCNKTVYVLYERHASMLDKVQYHSKYPNPL